MRNTDCAEVQRHRRFRAGAIRPWLRFLWISVASGSLPAAVDAIFGHPTWHRALNEIVSGVIFSACIGALCWLVLPRIAGRVLRLPAGLKWATLVSVIVILAALGCAAANAILLLIGLISPSMFSEHYVQSFKIAVLITLVFALSTFFHEVIVGRLNRATAEIKAREEAAEKLRQVATEARLSSLESRIHPHFLFNTLNSILALIRENPVAAERMVERLATLLRFSLDANQSRLVPLSSEAKIVRDYLEIEQARFGARLRFSFDIPAALENLAIPPMSLQTLVENSVKYAVAPSRDGASILIRAQAGLADARIDVIDDGPGFSTLRLMPGHGLELLQSRLEGLFGGSASLEFETLTSGGARVSIRLPLPVRETTQPKQEFSEAMR